MTAPLARLLPFPLLRAAIPPALRPDDGVEYAVPPVPGAAADPEARAPTLAGLRLLAGSQPNSPQRAVLGRRLSTADLVGLDLNGCDALAFFGSVGFGKTYALGIVVESGLGGSALCEVARPYCAVAYHFHPGASYVPELLDSIYPNHHPEELRRLIEDYGAPPSGVPELVVLTLPDQVAALRQQYPHCQVHGIRFPLRELGIEGVEIFLGLSGSRRHPLYARQIQTLLRDLRRRLQEGQVLTMALLAAALREASFAPRVRELIAARLELLGEWIDDGRSLRALLQPGRLLLVDVRDEWLDRELAMTLVALLNATLVLGADRRAGEGSHVMVVMDEVHKFVASPLIRAQIETMVRERRHLRLMVVLASQDPLSVPQEILALLDGVGLFRHDSLAWEQHLAKRVHALGAVTVERASRLRPGQMYFWARRWSLYLQDIEPGDFAALAAVPRLPVGPILVELRPRTSHHGGATLRIVS